MLMEPWKQYVSMVAISKIGIKNPEASEDEKDLLCISVGFRKVPPFDLDFPTEWEGVRVCYQIIGEIQFQ